MTSGEDENRISDSDLVSLRTDARWKRVLAQIEKAEENRRRLLSDPNRSLFVTSDIPRFWSAYDAALGLPPEQRAAVF